MATAPDPWRGEVWLVNFAGFVWLAALVTDESDVRTT
jgi:hypothetical protein